MLGTGAEPVYDAEPIDLDAPLKRDAWLDSSGATVKQLQPEVAEAVVGLEDVQCILQLLTSAAFLPYAMNLQLGRPISTGLAGPLRQFGEL